jgi:hypothetical protein
MVDIAGAAIDPIAQAMSVADAGADATNAPALLDWTDWTASSCMHVALDAAPPVADRIVACGDSRAALLETHHGTNLTARRGEVTMAKGEPESKLVLGNTVDY